MTLDLLNKDIQTDYLKNKNIKIIYQNIMIPYIYSAQLNNFTYLDKMIQFQLRQAHIRKKQYSKFQI